MGLCPRDTEANQEPPVAEVGQPDQQNEVVLKHNPKFKINTHEFILI